MKKIEHTIKANYEDSVEITVECEGRAPIKFFVTAIKNNQRFISYDSDHGGGSSCDPPQLKEK